MNYTPLFICIFVLQTCCASKNENIIINESLDENLLQIRETIITHGYDPLKLPNISITIHLKIAFYNDSITLNLTNGVMFGGSTMDREGDLYLTFHPRTVRIHGRVHFEKLKAKFNYSYDTRYYSDKGVLDATITNVIAAFNVDYKLLELLVVNPRIKLKNYGNLDLTITSDALFSPIVNVIINYAASHYKEGVINVVDAVGLDIAQQVLKIINKNLPPRIADLAVRFLQYALSGRLG